jgi:hypothetical protein
MLQRFSKTLFAMAPSTAVRVSSPPPRRHVIERHDRSENPQDQPLEPGVVTWGERAAGEATMRGRGTRTEAREARC